MNFTKTAWNFNNARWSWQWLVFDSVVRQSALWQMRTLTENSSSNAKNKTTRWDLVEVKTLLLLFHTVCITGHTLRRLNRVQSQNGNASSSETDRGPFMPEKDWNCVFRWVRYTIYKDEWKSCYYTKKYMLSNSTCIYIIFILTITCLSCTALIVIFYQF